MSDQFPPPPPPGEEPQGEPPAPQVPSGAWVANPGPGPMPGSSPGPAFPGPAPDRSTASRLRGLARFAVPVVAIGIAVAGYLGQADRDEAGAIVGAGDVAADDLRIGDCFDDGEIGDEDVVEVGAVAAKPCGEPHDNEVFHSFELTGDTLPSDDAIMQQAGEVCIEVFDTFVGTVYEESELDFFPMWPGQAAWDAGDRTVTCSIYALDGSKLTGSAQGTTR